LGSRSPAPLRSLPRAFVSGVPDDLPNSILLPDEEYSKFYKVLRMKAGDEVALLPGDGRLIRARLEGHYAVPTETHRPDTEARTDLTLCLAMPKADSLDESVRMGSELGVARFVLFPSERTVVRWDEKKREARLRRLRAIAREAAEVSFRTRMPKIALCDSLETVLREHAGAQVLSEVEGTARRIEVESSTTLVVGPEGGWAPREVAMIGERAVTLGPRVLRVDTAVAAACSLALLDR
jgi:16S rRNA (uracil1498-N3)-methyltransferase